MRFFAVYLLVISVFVSGNAQLDQKTLTNAAEELKDFIAIPNFGLNQSDVEKNIAWLVLAFEKRNFSTQILPTAGNPLFFAEQKIDEKLPTVLFYMHLDGQAVDASKWDQADPYELELRQKNEAGEWETMDWGKLASEWNPEWRLFGRSASDDKGPIIAFLQAIDLLNENKEKAKFNIKVVLDGEEEIGSKSLAGAVKKYRDLLAADALIINDGPVHLSGKPTLTFGCRGITTLNMTVYGPVLPQHSGHYGNYAPNPVFRMAHLLSSMKDESGRVLIEDYYEGISLDAATRKILAQVPDDETGIQELLQIAGAEQVGENYQESLQYPSLNVRGVAAGWVGARARTIVPASATAAIDIRLVPESEPKRLIAAIKKHIEKEGYHIVDREPSKAERMQFPKLIYFNVSKITYPFRTPLDSPVGDWLEMAIQNTFAEAPVKIRIMGGTVPIAAFINELKIPAVIVPMVNPDNNQHSPNENFRLGHFENAIRMFKGIMETGME